MAGYVARNVLHSEETDGAAGTLNTTKPPTRGTPKVVWLSFADDVINAGFYIGDWPVGIPILDAHGEDGAPYKREHLSRIIEACLLAFNDPTHARALKFKPLRKGSCLFWPSARTRLIIVQPILT